ncbi:low-density lipoprotein receptor-related protein 5-like [Xenia sp. Carnegie-2017]|uniref:low-density lipoprotein receptor-related protein 5-like n=1 Tax=Xenia sp. Carnegie-2017 TaxID=2897299 RepID=UPI001F03B68B|nr:low-density lipoprotein receptor-related protein 5-like [Xenia sp. Carnegie-2017]
MKESRFYVEMIFVLLVLVVESSKPLPSEPYLVYSNLTNLHIIDLKTWRSINILGGLDLVVPLGVDTKNQHIYFGEHVLGKIYRVNYNGSSQELIMENVTNIEGLAIDWIGRKIYWTAFLSETIEVATLDGKFRKVLVNTGLQYPLGMAVDPIAGFLFWTDWGVNATIERCDLDGSNRVILVSRNIVLPHGITLDLNTRRVYWIESWYDTISSMDYDGRNRKVIFENTGLSISNLYGFDLDITGDSIYFTDWQFNLIIGVNINTGAIFKNISVPTSLSMHGSMGLRIIDRSKQPDGIIIYDDCIDYHEKGCSSSEYLSSIKARTAIGYYNKNNKLPCKRRTHSQICGGYGWTKLGTVNTTLMDASYNSAIWTSSGPYQTAFNPMFWSTNVSEVCVMAGGIHFNVSVKAPSMRSLFFEKKKLYLSSQEWLKGIKNSNYTTKFNFVPGCYEAGFNVGDHYNSTSLRARFGIVSLKKEGCPSEDQAIGIGLHIPGKYRPLTIYSSASWYSTEVETEYIKIYVRSRSVNYKPL